MDDAVQSGKSWDSQEAVTSDHGPVPLTAACATFDQSAPPPTCLPT